MVFSYMEPDLRNCVEIGKPTPSSEIVVLNFILLITSIGTSILLV
jgi:hypothetical protein